jgi:hypothetical protein
LPGAPSFTAAVTKRGTGTSTALSVPPGLSLVTLSRTGAAAAPAGHDYAVDPPRLIKQPDDSYVAHVRVVNAGGSAAPASQVDLYVAAVYADGTLGAPPELPAELLLASSNLSLGGVSGFALPEADATFSIPLGSPLIDLLEAGWGLQLRADVPAAAGESDVLNNGAARVWFAADAPSG